MDLNSTEKVLNVLLSFVPDNDPIGTLELSEKLDIHRSSVSRILITLKKYGFLEQDGKTKRYMLGQSVADLGMAHRNSLKSRLVSIAQPYLLKLRNLINESVALEVLTGKTISMAYGIKGPQPVSVSFDYGEIAAVNANAGAKAILAFSSEQLVQDILGIKEKLPSYTLKTITDREIIKNQFKQIKKSGVGYDNEEYIDNMHAIAAPVFNNEKLCIAALVILVPSFRVETITDNSTISELKNTASKISTAIQNKIF